jgi:hypothetical protein
MSMPLGLLAQGYALTIVETPEEQELKEVEDEKKEDFVTPKELSVGRSAGLNDSDRTDVTFAAMSNEAHRIIEEAQARLNALSLGEYNKRAVSPQGTLESGAILTPGELANARILAAGEVSPETGVTMIRRF